jgi:hypothetical protein
MATIATLRDAFKAVGIPVETTPDFLTNGHDGVTTLRDPTCGYLHHTVARVLESVYCHPTASGWPHSEWRPDVPVPRCNVYGARARAGGCRSGCPYKGKAHTVFVSNGKAHHAGMANLGRIRMARAGLISARISDASVAGLADDFSGAGFESVGWEVDWAEGEDWPADLLDMLALGMRTAVEVFGWSGVGHWIHHRQATRRKPDMAYRGDIWARATTTPEEDDMPLSDTDVEKVADRVVAKLGEGKGYATHTDIVTVLRGESEPNSLAKLGAKIDKLAPPPALEGTP